MSVSTGYLAYVLEQLGRLGSVSARRMFGGVGLYGDDLFFGLVDDDVLYLRVDDANRADFLARGMAPFQPFKDKPEYSMSYYQAPADVLEDSEELARWARGALAVAARNAKAKRPKPKRPKPKRPKPKRPKPKRPKKKAQTTKRKSARGIRPRGKR